MSSKKLPLAEIREKYKRMAIAGDVRGFEAVPFLLRFDTNSYSTQVSINAVLLIDGSDVSVGDMITIEADDGTYNNRIVSSITSDTLYFDVPCGRLSGGIVAIHKAQTHKQAKPTWTDIIGSPANIAATFPEGVEGQWVPVIPDGTVLNVPQGRKYTTGYSREYTVNDGVAWNQSAYTQTSTTTNTTIMGWTAATVALYHYETQAHFTEDSDNSKVLDLGGVFGADKYTLNQGASLINSLNGGVLVGNASGIQLAYKSVEGGIHPTTNLLSGDTWRGYPTHNTIPLAAPTSGGTTAVKALDYLSSENGVAKLSYAYKEMAYDSGADSPNEHTFVNQSSTFSYVAGNVYKLIHSNFVKLRDSVFVAEVSFTDTASNVDRYSLFQDGSLKSSNGSTKLVLHDGNGWGDNNQFEIANNQTTQTDDNGNTIKYGTASFDTQYFVVEE
jgi:hypothetical protein